MTLAFPSLRIAAAAAIVAVSTGAAWCHEFWIDPESFTVAPGAPIVAALRVGERFEGSEQSYLPQNFRRFELHQGEAAAPVESRMGDRPALAQPAPGAGLAVVVHETTDYRLTYREADLFEAFVRHKDAAWVLEAHAARGLPETGFSELYSRYAKSLVAVGAGAGADRAVGLATEIVALANPYTDDVGEGLPVRLLYAGAPRPDAQIEVFEKAADGTVSVKTVRTDAAGEARVPVEPGHRYMLDAVVLRAPAEDLAEARDVVWESLWANLTFAVPDR